jgi:hypothetical protein
MVNEDLIVEVVTWIEKVAHDGDHMALAERLTAHLRSTSDGWQVYYGRFDDEGIIEVAFDMPMKRIAADVGLNPDGVAALKELLATIPADGQIVVQVYARGDEEVVRIRRFHYVPRERRDPIREMQYRIANMILSVQDENQGQEERQRVWGDAMRLTGRLGGDSPG